MLPEAIEKDLVTEQQLTIGVYGEHRIGDVRQDGFEPGTLVLQLVDKLFRPPASFLRQPTLLFSALSQFLQLCGPSLQVVVGGVQLLDGGLKLLVQGL